MHTDLVEYSGPGDPLQNVPDDPHQTASAFDADKPTRSVDVQRNAEWAKEIRHAAALR